MSDFSDLVGDVIIKMRIDEDRGEVRFLTIQGKKYIMHHIQDCCESVYLADVCGDWADIMDNIITTAEERTNRTDDPPEHVESFTWTFYELATPRGSLTMRWFGESNGYYSEDVMFEELSGPV